LKTEGFPQLVKEKALIAKGDSLRMINKTEKRRGCSHNLGQIIKLYGFMLIEWGRMSLGNSLKKGV